MTPFISLSAVATGTGAVVDFDRAVHGVSMAVIVSGAVLSGAVALDGSHDGENWVQLGVTGSLSSDANTAVSIGAGAWRYLRARVSTEITGGANATATIMESSGT